MPCQVFPAEKDDSPPEADPKSEAVHEPPPDLKRRDAATQRALKERERAVSALKKNLRAQLGWLRGTGRLSDEDEDEMLTHGVMVSDPRRLPCRQELGPNEVCHCPLFHRARGGDRDVPCTEAQAEAGLSPRVITTGDRPGEPGDPVRLLQIRPCFLLGLVATMNRSALLY